MRKSRINITKTTEIRHSIELKKDITYKHGEGSKYYTYLQKKQKIILETTGQSVSFQPLQKLWGKSSWKQFLGTWRRCLEISSMDLPQVNQCLTCLTAFHNEMGEFMNGWGESTLTFPRPSTSSPTASWYPGWDVMLQMNELAGVWKTG